MTKDTHSIRRAAALRDAAAGRVREVTAAGVALAAGLTGLFAAVAAGSTHFKHVVTGSAAGTAAHAAVVRRPTASPAGPVVAPAPSLVGIQGGGASPPPAQSQAAPQAAPASAQPVVVSGGS
jgi:hypothetical protein